MAQLVELCRSFRQACDACAPLQSVAEVHWEVWDDNPFFHVGAYVPCIAMQLWTALGRRVKRGRGVGCAKVCARSQQRLLRAQASVCYVTLAKVTISREISDDVAHPAVQLGCCACGHMMVSACCCTSGDAWGPLCHRRCERCARLCRCSHLTVGDIFLCFRDGLREQIRGSDQRSSRLVALPQVGTVLDFAEWSGGDF